jgi:phosphomevalonate kinase
LTNAPTERSPANSRAPTAAAGGARTIAARAPGKLVALGEYAVLDGAPALVLAVDRFCEATITPVGPDAAGCALETLAATPAQACFALGSASGVPLVDLVAADFGAAREAWHGRLDSRELFAAGAKLGLGSSAAALAAWAGAWARFVGRAAPSAAEVVALHRRFQAGRGSGIDVAASMTGGAVEFRLDGVVPRIGSVRLPNSVGFAGIFAGRPASTPEFIGFFQAFQSSEPRRSAALLDRLRATAEAGCAAARGDDAAAFIAAIADYGRGLSELGDAMGAEIVTAEHREIGAEAGRYGVAYKVSGAGGGDVGLAVAADADALVRFGASVARKGFRVIDFRLAEHGLTVEERA